MVLLLHGLPVCIWISIFVYVFLNMLRSIRQLPFCIILIQDHKYPVRDLVAEDFSRLKSFYVVREILFNKSGVCITLLKSLIFQDLILKINICFNAFYDDLA